MANSSTQTGTAAAAVAGGYTIAELLTKIEKARGITASGSTAAQTTEAEQALTAAGHTAATIDGADWWWLHGSGSFSLVASTATYALRSVSSAAMADLRAVERAYFDDDWPLRQIPYRAGLDYTRLIVPTGSNADPTAYSVYGEPPTMALYPTPDDTTTLYVDYLKVHPEVVTGGAASLLIVPAPYQEDIYFKGAMWLLREDVGASPGLEDCPGFMSGIRRMHASAPDGYDGRSYNSFADAQTGSKPYDRRVMGGLIQTPVS